MLVLVAFISICMIAVMFLLRFFFALQSEVNAHGVRSVTGVTRISADRRLFATDRTSTRTLTLIHSNSRLASASTSAFSQVESGSRFKQA